MGEAWYPGETVNSAIGQGYTLATPLQLATATMVLAGKGEWHQPVMLQRSGLEMNEVINQSKIPDVTLDNPDNWNFIQGAMEKVVHRGNGGYRDNGTAFDYLPKKKPLPYRMAGKSGTAQVISYAADYDDDVEVSCENEEHALFIAFAPVDDPKIAVAVFVEHGKGGSSVAGPIARGVIDSWLLGELPEPGEDRATCIGD
jgi:penicillin-binding protein 2